MPVRIDLFRNRPKTRRTMPRPGWLLFRTLLALLAVISVLRCATAQDAPSVRVSPTSLAFGSQLGGTTSSAQNLTVTNTGDATLNITQIGLTGSYPNCFRETNSCGTSLTAGSSCTISVQFAPSGVGSYTAAVTISDNAPNSPQSVALSGTGTGSPQVSFSNTALAFGSQLGGTTSSAQNLTVTNTGSVTLTITQLGLTGSYPNCFKETNSCGSSLAVGSSCTVSVQFAPSGVGSYTAAVTLNDNAPNSPQSVSLSGTGTNSGGNGDAGPNQGAGISLSPGSVSFGNQPVDVPSSPETITLSNISGALLSLSALAFTGANSGDFSENNTCGVSLAVGESCNVVILFNPSASGSRSASLSVTNTLTGDLLTASLSGTGTHDVVLTWGASLGAAGYDIYRGSSSGGESSTPLNSAPVTGTKYEDTTVSAGQTYYYEITAVAANGNTQSGKSSQVSATVPSP